MEALSDQFLKHALQILQGNDEKSEVKLRSISNMGVNIYFLDFQQISSTMLLSEKWQHSLLPENTMIVFIANSQTKGKGQNTNIWHSPSGNIYCTILTKQPLIVIQQLIPAVSVSIAETVEQSLQLSQTVGLKWVNDIMLNNRKISGTLIKSDVDVDGSGVVLQIGIGVNVNYSYMADSTCLREHCLGIKIDNFDDLDNQQQSPKQPYKPKSTIDQHTIQSIIDRLCIKILCNLLATQKPNHNSSIIQKYNERLVWKNEKVVIYDNNLQNVINSGVFKGINEHCFAMLKQDGGGIVKVMDGRMRKI